jgi:epoxyqueuosine reductase
MAHPYEGDCHQLAAHIKAQARRLGFDRAGIASAEASNYQDYFRQWLDNGNAGTMEFLKDRFAERINPAVYMAGAQSVICLAMNYYVPLKAEENSANGSNQKLGRIARYALGDDYHEILKHRLHELADWVRQAAPGSQTRCCVDTAPLMEKELAARAGIGWLGKNTCIINEQIGSWIFLGEIVTDLPLPVDAPALDRCGTCRKCIDACPTQAITEPYRLDARKCIAYLTIEHREKIEPGLAEKTGDWLFGCDICQDVCPWNRKAPEQTDETMQPRFPTAALDVEQLLIWTDEDYRLKLRRSAMKRVKLPMLKRNAENVLRNARS